MHAKWFNFSSRLQSFSSQYTSTTKASTQICYKIQGHVGEKITDKDWVSKPNWPQQKRWSMLQKGNWCLLNDKHKSGGYFLCFHKALCPYAFFLVKYTCCHLFRYGQLKIEALIWLCTGVKSGATCLKMSVCKPVGSTCNLRGK